MVLRAGKLPWGTELQHLLGGVLHSGDQTSSGVYAKLDELLAVRKVSLELPEAVPQTVSSIDVALVLIHAYSSMCVTSAKLGPCHKWSTS